LSQLYPGSALNDIFSPIDPLYQLRQLFLGLGICHGVVAPGIGKKGIVGKIRRSGDNDKGRKR
jgi:hypothetical protein